MKDIEQLLDAHSAITRFANARQAAKRASRNLADIVKVVGALVTKPGRGRPREVDALNRAGFVLAMSHFQGFVDDLHAELGSIVLRGKVADPKAVIELVKSPRSNPHVHVINQMFAGLGIYELMAAVKWQKCDNKTVRSRLTKYLEARNRIAHGKKEAVTKVQLTHLKEFIERLATKLDEAVAIKGAALTGMRPW